MHSPCRFQLAAHPVGDRLARPTPGSPLALPPHPAAHGTPAGPTGSSSTPVPGWRYPASLISAVPPPLTNFTVTSEWCRKSKETEHIDKNQNFFIFFCFQALIPFFVQYGSALADQLKCWHWSVWAQPLPIKTVLFTLYYNRPLIFCLSVFSLFIRPPIDTGRKEKKTSHHFFKRRHSFSLNSQVHNY